MPPPPTEQIAERITGGQLSAARSALQEIGQKYTDLYSETRKLSREVEHLKDGGGMLAEGYADASWNNRLDLDRNWLVISGYQNHRVIQKTDENLYHDLLNYAYQYSPLLKAAIDIKTRYTFGLSYSVESEDEGTKELIAAIMDDPRNNAAMFGARAVSESDRELQRAGSLYFAIWPGAYPVPQVRVWTAYDIVDVLTDPNDSDTALFFVREWTDNSLVSHRAVYPSVFNPVDSNTVTISGVDVTVDNSIRVYQMCEGRGIRQKWTISPLAAALPWNRAYEKFLLDFAVVVEMLRKYSTMFTTKGGDAQVTALQGQFAHDQSGHHANQLGNMLVGTEGNDLKVIDAGSGKIVGPADSRFYLLQICAVTGVPENLLTGNPQTGNRASAQELTTNFLPIIEERQTLWDDAFTAIFRAILGPDADFDVSFPPLRTQDALTYLQTLTQAATLGQAGKLAGTIRPEDFIRAAYEAMDLKVPDDATVDEMVADLIDRMNSDPGMAGALDNLTRATNNLMQQPGQPQQPDLGPTNQTG
jgi:hypothetical protein